MKQRRQRTTKTERTTLGYIRVSSFEQAQTGVSLDAQEAKIVAYATAMDFSVSEVVRDAGESAKSLKRPGIARILEAVRRGEVDRVVVTKCDRLTRAIRDLNDLFDLFAKHGVALVSVTESLDTGSASGRLVCNLLGVVSQWEREAIAERTSVALAHKRQHRTVYGSTPFGYVREGSTLIIDATEQAALSEAIRMDRAGASFREIGRMLEARGVAPKRARVWHAASVRAVLRSRIATEAYT